MIWEARANVGMLVWKIKLAWVGPNACQLVIIRAIISRT